jgi:plasmid stabilization system protein ParE
VDTIEDNETNIKPARPTSRCMEMLDKAMKYYEEVAPKQAEILQDKFFEILEKLETFSGMGSKYEKGMRKFLLGKFPYYIYYKESESKIEILGIWHTSRGTNFEDKE